MREIKFRCWDKLENRMSDDNESKYWLMQGFDVFFWKNYHFMQFTGLTDKNGKEIYEGDYNKNFDVVIWCQRCAGWQFGVYHFPTKEFIICQNCEGYFMFQDGISDFEIIGNIYQNPDLLK